MGVHGTGIWITESYNVDTQRIYAIGIGNGGFMALKVACELPQLFAAIASFGGIPLTTEFPTVGSSESQKDGCFPN